jgi:hypothetical protein
MSLDELETIKDKIVEKKIYFQTFKKDKLSYIMDDFQKENYTDGFLHDLENGLKKSSVFRAN